jgi:hypothetical protein
MTKTLKLKSYPKKVWSYKKEPERSLGPIKDTLLLIFMNLEFNFFTITEIIDG